LNYFTRVGFLLSTIGSAVWLGNIWNYISSSIWWLFY